MQIKFFVPSDFIEAVVPVIKKPRNKGENDIFFTESSRNKTIRAEPRLNKVSVNSLYNRMLGLAHIHNLTVHKMSGFLR